MTERSRHDASGSGSGWSAPEGSPARGTSRVSGIRRRGDRRGRQPNAGIHRTGGRRARDLPHVRRLGAARRRSGRRRRGGRHVAVPPRPHRDRSPRSRQARPGRGPDGDGRGRSRGDARRGRCPSGPGGHGGPGTLRLRGHNDPAAPRRGRHRRAAHRARLVVRGNRPDRARPVAPGAPALREQRDDAGDRLRERGPLARPRDRGLRVSPQLRAGAGRAGRGGDRRRRAGRRSRGRELSRRRRRDVLARRLRRGRTP